MRVFMVFMVFVAVRRGEGDAAWILRATINSESFAALVRASALDQNGDIFILDRGGRYQTTARGGPVLSPSGIPLPPFAEGIQHSHVEVGGQSLIRASQWLNHERWLLVVQRTEADIVAPLNRAVSRGLAAILLAVTLLVLTTLLATRHLTSRIDRANAERDAAQRDLVRSARLASLGEMATGLAHEVNNPLAIISAELTNIDDTLAELEELAAAISEARQEAVYARDRLEIPQRLEQPSVWRWLKGSHGSRPLFVFLGAALFTLVVASPVPDRLLGLVSVSKVVPPAR